MENHDHFDRRKFLSLGSLVGLSVAALPPLLLAKEESDGKIGEMVVQPTKGDGVFYLSVKENAITGDVQYDGYATRSTQEDMQRVLFVVRRGLLQTTAIEESKEEQLFVRVGVSGQYQVALHRDTEETNFFYGHLRDQGTGDALKFLYRDFQPVPIILVIIGAAVAFCAALTVLDQDLKKCLEQARVVCSKSAVKEVKVVRVFGIRKDQRWDVGCHSDCEIQCYPPPK